MKTLFTSCSGRLGLISSLAFLFSLSGCTEEKPLPSMTFDEPEVSVPAEASVVKIPVRLENFPDDYELQFSCPDDWAQGFKEAEKGVISFNVAANEAGESRSTEVTVNAEGLECGGSFTVVQAGKSGEEPDPDPEPEPDPDAPLFEIIIHGVTPSTVAYSVIPRDKQMTYMVMIAERLYFDSFESEEDFFNDCIDMFIQYANEKGIDLYEYLKTSVLQTGDDLDNEMFVIETKTVRYICVNGINENAEMTTSVFKVPFAEGYEGFEEMDFDISYEIDGVDVAMTVIPSDNDRRYYVDAVEKEIADFYGIEFYMQEKINQLVSVGEIFGKTAEEMINDVVWYGQETIGMTMDKPNAAYVGCAFSLEPYGIINSNITTKEFMTGEIDASDNVVTIEMSDINVNSAHYKTATTNDDGYVVFFEPVEDWEGMSDEEIIAELIDSNVSLEYYVLNGDYEDDVTGLQADTDYWALAFGFDGGVATTGLFRTPFRTLTSTSSADMTFEITVSNVQKFGADVTIKAEPETSLYYWSETAADATEDEIRASIDEAVEHEIWAGFFETRAEYFYEYGTRGSFTEWRNLFAGTAYKIYAVGIDENTGEYTTGFYYSEPFETLPVY